MYDRKTGKLTHQGPSIDLHVPSPDNKSEVTFTNDPDQYAENMRRTANESAIDPEHVDKFKQPRVKGHWVDGEPNGAEDR